MEITSLSNYACLYTTDNEFQSHRKSNAYISQGMGGDTLIFLYTYAQVQHLPFIQKKCLEYQATEKNI